MSHTKASIHRERHILAEHVEGLHPEAVGEILQSKRAWVSTDGPLTPDASPRRGGGEGGAENWRGEKATSKISFASSAARGLGSCINRLWAPVLAGSGFSETEG